ncbi:glycosyltransferase [Paraneptunicella aestuarii]|uniref:glycosyltransferase n=1 Tax=Paraneptunicella aestuarii TaxID=2831148 RepID=UPI001E436246|nr:glycosyltransferase [Paraneptunicella aestuarii]UAA39736.1 glycosyltransferase [Paraneptunicella aestuarii]
MRILEVYLECGGYDYQLIKGGISVYTWNLSNALLQVGKEQASPEPVEEVAILTAMHGQQAYLQEKHGLVELDYEHQWQMRIDADPAIWGSEYKVAGQQIKLDLTTKAYRLDKGDVSIYILSNHILDLYPDTYYPPYESKGKDIGFFKPLVFQAEVIHFIRHYFAEQKWIVHAHEPYYQYLIPPAFQHDDSKLVISTVQSNMPINKKVYLPKVISLCEQLDIAIEPEQFVDDFPATPFNQCLLDYLPFTHLNYPYPDDYVNLFALCVEYSDKVDFLSEGHLEFYSQFYGTAFRPLFTQLRIGELVAANQHKFFVGGCAISDSWLQKDFSVYSREQTLQTLGLNPALPTFFHNARYAPNHKGQVELVLAVERFLAAGNQANFILRCVSGSGIPDQRFHELATNYSDKVVLRWEMQAEDELMAMAAASDFALFPSKFEMDTFLIAIGEAMLAQCVPIASEQLGMKHWWQCEQFSEGHPATGFSVIRSFREEDPELIESLLVSFEQSMTLFSDPVALQKQKAYAREHALTFTWQQSAKQHLAVMNELVAGSTNKPESQFSESASLIMSQGELVSTRFGVGELQDDQLPVLHVSANPTSGNRIEYRFAQAVSVVVFIPMELEAKQQSERFERLELEQIESGVFAADVAFEQVQNVFLLVTVQGGDQFWDGMSDVFPVKHRSQS